MKITLLLRHRLDSVHAGPLGKNTQVATSVLLFTVTEEKPSSGSRHVATPSPPVQAFHATPTTVYFNSTMKENNAVTSYTKSMTEQDFRQ